MVDQVEPITLLPGEITFEGGFAGDILPFTLTFPWDVSASTHKMLISKERTGTAQDVLTNGDGITVGSYSGGVTQVSVTVSAEILADSATYYWYYKVDGTTQFWGTIQTEEGLTE